MIGWLHNSRQLYLDRGILGRGTATAAGALIACLGTKDSDIAVMCGPDNSKETVHMADTNEAKRDSDGQGSQTSTVLEAGTRAPDFSLRAAPDRSLTLSELRGHPVIVAFYPADWSPVCSDQMALYNEILPEFAEYGAQLVGISVDGAWCHKAFSQSRNLHFDLLADFEPKGAISHAYGAYRKADGFSERALFVIDANGVIRWSYLSPVGVNPGADGIINALTALTDEQRGQPSATEATRSSSGSSARNDSSARSSDSSASQSDSSAR
jgi:peroxiredoxin